MGVEVVLVKIGLYVRIELMNRIIIFSVLATLWGLVNNAGVVGYMGFYDWWTRDEYRRKLEVNLLGPIEVTNVFLPLMRSKGKGRIVNVSSGIALAPFSAAGYELSKCALEAFSDCLR